MTHDGNGANAPLDEDAQRIIDGLGNQENGQEEDGQGVGGDDGGFTGWTVDPTLTDSGNGSLFAQLKGNDFRYALDVQTWFTWDGKRWREAHTPEMLDAAKAVSQVHLDKAALETNPDRSKVLNSWGNKSRSEKGLKSTVVLATTEKAMQVKLGQLDQHPDLLTVANGTLNLRTGVMMPHDRGDLLTKMVAIDYDPQATCPRWLQFLDEVFNGDQELVKFIQRAVGYSLTGHTREQVFFILHGAGCNGKGRFINILQKLLGDYAKGVSFEAISYKREPGENTPGVAELPGCRVAVCPEPGEGVRFNEPLIKSLTGQDTISAMKKHKPPFNFDPQFRLWIHSNHKPEIRGTDDGIWRRPKLVPFNVNFTGREDRQLDEKLGAELPGILRWALEGAMEWYAEGLGSCNAVNVATKAYRQESDAFQPFVNSCVTPDPTAFTSNKRLLEVYNSWCQANGQEPWKPDTVKRRMRAKGYQTGNQGATYGFKGFAVTL